MTSDGNHPKYQPGRIQTITSEQEVVLKQVWAYMLKYWGYDVNIGPSDIGFKESYVPSSSSVERSMKGHQLRKTNTKDSTLVPSVVDVTSSKSVTSKKKGFFGRSQVHVEKAPPSDSRRLHAIQTKSSSEKFVPVEQPSERMRYIYFNVLKASFDEKAWESDSDTPRAMNREAQYQDDDSASLSSLETFITACTSVSDFEEDVKAGEKHCGNVNAVGTDDRIEHRADANGYSTGTQIRRVSSVYSRKGRIMHPRANDSDTNCSTMPAQKRTLDPKAISKSAKKALMTENNSTSNGEGAMTVAKLGQSVHSEGKKSSLPPEKKQYDILPALELNGGIDRALFHTREFDASLHKDILPCLMRYDPVKLHKILLSSTRHALVDNFVLKYIRARKLDYEKAIEMFVRSLDWRDGEHKAEQWLLEGDSVSFVSGKNKGFVKHFETEKSIVRGVDRHGFPIFWFRARYHFARDSTVPEAERFAVTSIEWAKLFMSEVTSSLDQSMVVFDLTGFSLKNADNGTIKFLAEVFEAHYPETLSNVLIHNAPWIFSTLWNIIKNWLDPYVASKVHFTKDDSIKDFIDPSCIPEYIGGKVKEPIKYPVPSAEHTHPPKKKDDQYKQLVRERDITFIRYLELTRKWVESTNPYISSKYLEERLKLSIQLAENYISLDPYVRNPGIYDRLGVLELRL